MPVSCPIEFPRLTSDQFKVVDYPVMATAFAIHNELGCHWNEYVYQSEMHSRLSEAIRRAAHEVPLTVNFGSFTKTYRLDLVVDTCGLYELKTVAAITKEHIGQVLNYLRLLNATRAKIINFRPHLVETKFINCSDTTEQRRNFVFQAADYRGPAQFQGIAEAMFRDFGTKLSLALYTDCLLTNAGRIEHRRIWADREVGQDFRMIAEDQSFVVTTMKSDQRNYRTHLERMRCVAGLKFIHWLNSVDDVVTLESVS